MAMLFEGESKSLEIEIELIIESLLFSKSKLASLSKNRNNDIGDVDICRINGDNGDHRGSFGNVRRNRKIGILLPSIFLKQLRIVEGEEDSVNVALMSQVG